LLATRNQAAVFQVGAAYDQAVEGQGRCAGCRFVKKKTINRIPVGVIVGIGFDRPQTAPPQLVPMGSSWRRFQKLPRSTGKSAVIFKS
jgi:hypothetical protein